MVKKYVPCIIATFWVVVNIIEETTEVDKDRAWNVWRKKMGLHLQWRCKRGNSDGALVQTHMVPLTKRLNQSSTLEQRKNPSFNSFFLLYKNVKITKLFYKILINANKLHKQSI